MGSSISCQAVLTAPLHYQEDMQKLAYISDTPNHFDFSPFSDKFASHWPPHRSSHPTTDHQHLIKPF